MIINDDALKFAAGYSGPGFHALLCDPPYHLTSITERFGKNGSAAAQYGSEVIGASLAGWEEVTGVEMEQEYAEIAEARVKHWLSNRQLELVR